MTLEISRQQAAPQLKPVIAEILRTCVYPSVINLRVEQVNKQRVEYDDPKNHNRHGNVIKTYLTDGELVIQGLLHRNLCALAEVDDLTAGDVIEIHKFVVKKAKRTNGHGDVLYLGIEDCYVLKNEAEQDERMATSSEYGSTSFTNSSVVKDRVAGIDDMAGGFFPDYGDSFTEQDHIDALIEQADRLTDLETIENTTSSVGKFTIHGDQLRSQRQSSGRSSPPYQTPRKRRLAAVDDTGSDDEAFETLRVDLHTAKKRREVLHELSQNLMSSPLRPPTRGSAVMSVAKKDTAFGSLQRKPNVRFDISKCEVQYPLATVIDEKHPNESRTDSRHNYHVHDQEAYRLERTKLLGHSLPTDDPTASKPPTPIHTSSQFDSFGPYHNLASLYSPSLPSKSYTFTTLIVPTQVSTHLITRPNSPFPPKRHIKVIDSSIFAKFSKNGVSLLGKGVTVSVYRDAVAFKPTLGKAALMRGVVMQRISGAMKSGNKSGQGEVILNVYPVKSRIQKQSQNTGQRSQQMTNDLTRSRGQDENADTRRTEQYLQDEHELNQSKSQAGLINSQLRADDSTERHWFVDDHDSLRQYGYDVDTMQQWWDKMMTKK